MNICQNVCQRLTYSIISNYTLVRKRGKCMKTYYLSIDLGASSGRAIVTEKVGWDLLFHEIHRFKNRIYEERGTLYWDFSWIYANVLKSIEMAFERYPEIKAIGIDSWGVDYGLLDASGELMRDPACYRDARGRKAEEIVYAVIDKKRHYRATGIQHLHFNTIFQLAYDAHYEPEIFRKAAKVLLIPDLIAYMLTGKQRAEITNLSTTGLFSPFTGSLIPESEALGIGEDLFPEKIEPGEAYGLLKEALSRRLGVPQVPVVAVCSHDTASAVLTVEDAANRVYISSGTWSLCGTVLDEPDVSETAYLNNFTNELGQGGKIRFLKNIAGLWIANECRRAWSEAGKNFSYEELNSMAAQAPGFRTLFDPDDPLFVEPGMMPERIRDYCLRSGETVPKGAGAYYRAVYDSLACKYRYVIEGLESIVGRRYDAIVIIGGGSRIDLLNQLTASVTGKKVVTGAQEATIMGNALILMLYGGDVSTVAEGRRLLMETEGEKRYLPLEDDDYAGHYQRFLERMKKN